MSTVKEVRSVHRAVEILALVARQQPLGVSEIARETELDKSTVHRIVVTLESAGWLQRDQSSAWSMAPGVAEALRNSSMTSFVASMQTHLDEIRDATGETTMLVVLEGAALSVIAVAESPQPLRIGAPPGASLPARNSSAVQAIAALALDDHELFEELLRIDPGLDPDELESVRARGWAVNDGAIVDDVCVVGSAVVTADGAVRAAVIVAGPSSRVRDARVREIGELLAGRFRVSRTRRTRSSGH